MVCAAVGRRRRRATRSGMVGSLFTTGAVAIALAACLRAWHSPSANRLWSRVFAVLVALAAFVAAANLPILVGWQIFGRTWFAEEVDVLVTAPLAMLLGQRWLRFGFRAPQGA